MTKSKQVSKIQERYNSTQFYALILVGSHCPGINRCLLDYSKVTDWVNTGS